VVLINFYFISGQKATKSVLAVCGHEPNLNIRLISLSVGKQTFKQMQPNIYVIFGVLSSSLLNVCAPGEISVHFACACSPDTTVSQQLYCLLALVIGAASYVLNDTQKEKCVGKGRVVRCFKEEEKIGNLKKKGLIQNCCKFDTFGPSACVWLGL